MPARLTSLVLLPSVLLFVGIAQAQPSNIGVSFKCVTDSAKFTCRERVLLGESWHVIFEVFNKGQGQILNWSYDIDLIGETSGDTIPLATQIAGDPLPQGGYAVINSPSPFVFDESHKGTSWRAEVRAQVKDPDHPEPDSLTFNNRASWSFRVDTRGSDIGVGFKCVTDSLKYQCLDHVFPGTEWHVYFNVYNKGERPITNWSYDIDLINQATGDTIPLKTQVPGESLPLGGYQYINWPSSYVFDESQKGTSWQALVTVQVKDAEGPEPEGRQDNNQASWKFQVANPFSDIGVQAQCVTDSAKSRCVDHIFPGQQWHMFFYVFNKGDKPLEDWSYDVDLINLTTGDTIPVKAQIPGASIPLNSARSINWSSPYVFDENQKGTRWQVDVTVRVKDPDSPEPSDRLVNNRSSLTFGVDNPFSDIGITFKCVTDSAKRGCFDRVFPEQPWHVLFEVLNKGDKPLEDWSYDIDLIDQATGDTIPIATQIPGEPVPLRQYRVLNWQSSYLFDESQKGTSWRVEVTVRVKDPSSPEPDGRLVNNRASWVFQVENPVSDIGTSFICVTDSLIRCLDHVIPGRPWYVFFQVVNKGDKRLDDWSYDIDLVDQATNDTIPLKSQVPGPSIGVGEYQSVSWPSTHFFDESQKGTSWLALVTVRVKNPNSPEPDGRQFNNQTWTKFRVENPVSDIGITFKCVTDSLKARFCPDHIVPGSQWHVVFDVYNKGEKAIENWSYDIDLINQATGDTIPLKVQAPGAGPIPVSEFRRTNWTSNHVFDESEKGTTWRVEVTVRVKEPGNPEPANRQYNNHASATFQVLNAVSDIGLIFKCITDPQKSRCLDHVSPGQSWHVFFGVYNKGEKAIQNWSYDIDLINQATGDTTPLQTQVPGEPLALGEFRYLNAPSSVVFDESQKGTQWRVEVRVQVKEPGNPEPANRQFNNRISAGFLVENPVSDIGIVFKCVMDSLKASCLNRVAPRERWQVRFEVYNKGDKLIDNWSYDVDLINQANGDTIPLEVQRPGVAIEQGGFRTIDWQSPYMFDEGQKGTSWRVRVTVRVKEPGNPEPANRQFNNQLSTVFTIENRPVADIGVQALCVTPADSLKECSPYIYIKRPWHVDFTVANKGNLPVTHWSFDITLVNQLTGDVTPLALQISGHPLDPGASQSINWSTGYAFGEDQQRQWRVDVEATVKDASTDTIQGNNRRSVKFDVISKPTPTLLALFQAEPVGEGLELRWQFGEPARIADVRVERGEAASGPWRVVAVERREEGGVTVALDRSVMAGRTYYYRLVATDRSGGTLTFGPLAVSSGEATTAFALSLAPNPSNGPTRADFAVPRAAWVRLSVVDIQGRDVVVLAEGQHPAGRYQATWSGRTERGAAPAGLYFVRYQTPEKTFVRRLVLAQ